MRLILNSSLIFPGSTFSKFFGGDSAKPVTESSDEEKSSDEKPVEEKAAEEKQEKPKANKTTDSDKKTNDTSKNATEAESKDIKPKIVTIKEPIRAEETILSINVLNKEQLSASAQKLQKLNDIERELNHKATARNNLESFVIDVQNKLYEDEYTDASTKEEVEKIRAACSEISDWLYEDGSDADANTYEKKLDELHTLSRELFSRVWEHKERPEALKALHHMLNQSSHFLLNAKNLTKTTNLEKDIFTDVEVETLEKLINETSEWRDKMVKEQKSVKKYEPVKLTVKMLMDKMAALDREMKYLVNKIKMWRPKKVEKPAGDNKSTSKNETVTNDEEKMLPIEELTSEEATIQEPQSQKEEKENVESENLLPSDDEDSENHSEL